MEKKRILIIDDDEDIIESLSRLLESAGYAVDTAVNGEEAIKKSKEKVYNVALIDVVLPDMTGIDLLTKLEERKPATKKIIITGYASLDNAVKALNLGANAYLIKPVDPEELINTVKKQITEQENELAITQEKVVKFIETRVKQLEEGKVIVEESKE
ncbi:MAG: response regulator [Candidatus Methanomethyliales bacterium]|nr:response regulator [Candidatus Methanomethylicales archaeon]